MNEIKVKVDFEKGTIEKQGITLVSGDYKSTKIVFDFCDAVGTKIFEMNDTEGNLLFSQTIVNNEVILVGEDDEGNDATLFETEGRYPFEVSLYNNGGKLTSANDCLNVTASLVEIGDTIVTPYLPLFDALMTQIDNINITSATVQDGHTITITNKSGTSTTFTVYDGAYCVSITKTGETATGSFIYTMTFSDGRTFDFTSPKGQAGSDGADGEDGRGIVSITKTSTVGLVDTYTISYTDSTTSSFTVTNGRDGQGGATTWDSITGKPTAFNPDINGLTSDTSLANGDKFPFYNGTTNKKISFDSLLTIINNALGINDKQDKNDNTLTTTSKQIVGAINELDSEMDNKVDKVEGKGLSTNDYTTEEKTKVANAITEHQSLAAYRTSASQDIIDAAQNNDIANKQATLVSGTNIKTINNQSLLGSGNIDISGGGDAVQGVKVGGTELTKDADGKVNVALNTPLFWSSNKLFVDYANTNKIDTRVSNYWGTIYYPITPPTLNYAVKAALTDANRINDMTEQEKANARGVIGAIGGNFELIEEITTTEVVSDITRSQEPNATPYNFSRVVCLIELSSGNTNTIGYSYKINDNMMETYWNITAGGYLAMSFSGDAIGGRLFTRTAIARTSVNGGGNFANQPKSPANIGWYSANSITSISILDRNGNGYPIGTKIKIYGVRA